jgi:hypothetical protein
MLFVFFVVLLTAFIIVQVNMPKTATVPSHIIKNRSVLAALWYIFASGASMVVLVYFLPVWFQAIKGVSAVKSGIMNIPLLLSMMIASISAGILTRKIGYYAPWMLIGATFMPIGAGLITTFKVLYGLSLGIGMQQPNIAVQTVLQRRDVPIGTSLVFFFQNMGGSIFISIANSIFDNKLKQGCKTSQVLMQIL